jgi:exo-beta-1,3-glucanase (GH17 family)
VPVVITEAGWATRSNGRGIPPANADERNQQAYLDALTAWSREHDVLTFLFEAFDEAWKGSADVDEPEKHWGLFTADRHPKLVLRGQ